ncbi:MAG TPA: hypothetical protein VGB22_04440 [candidate division Zixibacteria bacterium]
MSENGVSLARTRCAAQTRTLLAVLILVGSVCRDTKAQPTVTLPPRVTIRQFIESGSFDSAQARIDSVLSGDSTLAWPWLMRDDIARRLENPARRRHALQEALQRSPEGREVRLRLAEFFLSASWPDSARPHITWLEKSSAEPDLQTLFLIGRFAEQAGMPDSAVQCYMRVWDEIDRRKLFWLIE